MWLTFECTTTTACSRACSEEDIIQPSICMHTHLYHVRIYAVVENKIDAIVTVKADHQSFVADAFQARHRGAAVLPHDVGNADRECCPVAAIQRRCFKLLPGEVRAESIERRRAQMHNPLSQDGMIVHPAEMSVRLTERCRMRLRRGGTQTWADTRLC